MLQKIRDHLHGAIGYTILGAIALVFVAWGAYGIVDVGIGRSAFAAKVNGEKIPLETARQAWLDQQAQVARAFGGEIPAERRAELQQSVLEGLIARTMIDARVHDLGYRVTDAQIREAIEHEPAFQVDGKYSATIAKARLAQVGLSVQAFEADLRTSLARQQLQRAIGVSEFVTKKELDRIVGLEDEQREVTWALLTAADFAPARIDEAAVRAYYDANTQQYMTTESVRLAWGELRLDQAAAQITVVDEDLRKLYAEHKDRYVEPERRRARHILVADEKTADDVLAKLKAGGDFAALAKQYSKDAVSAANGGDLGFATRATFVAPFADAVFGMKVGELRGPVKTQYGYHVIQLEAIEPGKTKTFEEARPDLEAQYRREQAADRFGDAEEQLQTRLELPGATIESLAKEFGLATGVVDNFERGAGGGVLGGSPALQDVVFSDAVLNQGRVGGPVALGEDRVVVVKVLEHRKPVARPLADVRDQVVATLKHQQGLDAARAAAQAALGRLQAGDAFAVALAGRRIEGPRYIGRTDPSAPAAVRTRVFATPRPQGKPIYEVVPTDDGAAVVAVLESRADPAPLSAEARQERVQNVVSRLGTADIAAYVAEARRKAKVTVNPSAFE
ncbi:MAG: Peptidyl-prolyl cis-trans isomerase D [Steroidobacteraceae bacterium]|nr:Peptidyl-prolyl cis-trans isomerase D [Steroidobacteraceae bacterium]